MGPAWWEGWWPDGGINSLDDLEQWVDDRLNEMISLNWHSPKTLGDIAKMVGRQAVRNAIRYLDRHGRGDHPPQPIREQVEHIEQIEGALGALLRYIRRERSQASEATIETDAVQERPSPSPEPIPKRSAGGDPPKRSWVQNDLDEAIRRYKAERASTYRDLVQAVQSGKPGAKKAATRLFGRNSITKALGVKSVAMVSYSQPWRDIAEELCLAPVKGGTLRKSGKIGLDIAVEAKAQAEEKDVSDLVVSRETLSLLKKHLPAEAADALANRLHTGDTTDEEAREMVRIYREQKADRKSDKAF